MKCLIGLHDMELVGTATCDVETYERTRFFYKCTRCQKRKVVKVKGVWPVDQTTNEKEGL